MHVVLISLETNQQDFKESALSRWYLSLKKPRGRGTIARRRSVRYDFSELNTINNVQYLIGNTNNVKQNI
tara:strand:+ start:78 stop:287 length:210 start_codon:yes stop_codon:yes gene_type:complete